MAEMIHANNEINLANPAHARRSEYINVRTQICLGGGYGRPICPDRVSSGASNIHSRQELMATKKALEV